MRSVRSTDRTRSVTSPGVEPSSTTAICMTAREGACRSTDSSVWQSISFGSYVGTITENRGRGLDPATGLMRGTATAVGTGLRSMSVQMAARDAHGEA